MPESDYDRPYGPDRDMTMTGKATITSVIAHLDCRCASLQAFEVHHPCSRCLALQEIKRAWPWWYFNTLGHMGARHES